MKEQFLNALRSTNRPGMEDLLNWLQTTDFFEAPASTQHHGCFEGGLCYHSLNVYNHLEAMHDAIEAIHKEPLYSKETLLIVALLHDVCKADFYKPDTRNKKVDGKWVTVPCYSYDDKQPFGHGEKSLYLVSKYIDLTDDEALAIRWHMGGFDASASSYVGGQALSAALNKCKLIALIHSADFVATQFEK